MPIDPAQMQAIEAAAFRRLVHHLQQHTEVQNIDLMILADFCRNCLSKWVASAATEQGVDFDYDSARSHVYGMPYEVWKQAHQRPATPEQLQALADRRSNQKA